jgi:hypothetical protein
VENLLESHHSEGRRRLHGNIKIILKGRGLAINILL